jgi:hypothetical protein
MVIKVEKKSPKILFSVKATGTMAKMARISFFRTLKINHRLVAIEEGAATAGDVAQWYSTCLACAKPCGPSVALGEKKKEKKTSLISVRTVSTVKF